MVGLTLDIEAALVKLYQPANDDQANRMPNRVNYPGTRLRFSRQHSYFIRLHPAAMITDPQHKLLQIHPHLTGYLDGCSCRGTVERVLQKFLYDTLQIHFGYTQLKIFDPYLQIWLSPILAGF